MKALPLLLLLALAAVKCPPQDPRCPPGEHFDPTLKHCIPNGSPEPTPSPTPSPEPSPTPSPTPSPSPEPTPLPTPEPTPSPNPTGPYPPFSYINGHPRGTPPFPVGTDVTVDTTEHFGGHSPCDQDHPVNGHTDCADPRGHIWTVSGCDKVKLESDNFMATCRGIHREGMSWQSCIQPNPVHGDGSPYKFSPNAKRCVSGLVEAK